MHTQTVYLLAFVNHSSSSHVVVSLTDVQDIEDPLYKVEADLVGGDIPLQLVHIKAKLIDLAAQVNKTSPHVHSILFYRW